MERIGTFFSKTLNYLDFHLNTCFDHQLAICKHNYLWFSLEIKGEWREGSFFNNCLFLSNKVLFISTPLPYFFSSFYSVVLSSFPFWSVYKCLSSFDVLIFSQFMTNISIIVFNQNIFVILLRDLFIKLYNFCVIFWCSDKISIL